MVMKISILCLTCFIFIKLGYVIKAEPLLELNTRIYMTHVVATSLYYMISVAYVVSFDLYVSSSDYK